MDTSPFLEPPTPPAPAAPPPPAEPAGASLRPPRSRRGALAVLVVGVLAVAAVVAWRATRTTTRWRARAPATWAGALGDRTEVIAPREGAVDAGTGERVRAFEGFGLQVDGPVGAHVLVDGDDRGTAPLLTTVSCAPGDAVAVVLQRGAQRAATTTRCRANALVQLELRFPAPAR